MVVIMDRFTADSCLDLIATEHVTTSHMVPANFVRILEAPWPDFDLTSVRKILHAAAPCPPAVKRRIIEVFPPGSVWEYYGMSEGMATVISPEEWIAKPGSVGRAFPGLQIVIRDESGVALATGETGLVYVSTMPGMPKFRYHNAPEKTAEAWQGDFFTVGDLGWLDDDGYLFLADRRVDLILRGGVNIYPAEIEHGARHASRRRRLGGVRAPRRTARAACARDRGTPRRCRRGRRCDHKSPAANSWRTTSCRLRTNSSRRCPESPTERFASASCSDQRLDAVTGDTGPTG